ncbi:effector binding domain-containing protein [Bacillus xiapuensis]|uniref:effector binding domain-containing protein n=1 Tax=Bacillus xiapuensis TaxID=2014075 RepID=UPI000C241905|nr:effector binding domain-containing protein [Bacillus xiapuensis]
MQTYCQSCGMPLTDQAKLGTEKNGQSSQDYCFHCYHEGEYRQPDISMEEMAAVCVPHFQKEGMEEAEARQLFLSLLPTLKRWQKRTIKEPALVKRGAFQIAGVTARTCNADEMTSQGKIPLLWTRFHEQAAPLLKTGVTYGCYSNYEDGINGEYTITVGVEASSNDQLPAGLELQSIPSAKYLVFTSVKGPITAVVLQAWQTIWSWFPHSEWERTYTGDFEVYDERCADPEHAEVDIYIAVR